MSEVVTYIGDPKWTFAQEFTNSTFTAAVEAGGTLTKKDIATGMTKVVTNVDAAGTNVPAMGATQYYLQQEVTYNGDPKWTFAQEFTNSTYTAGVEAGGTLTKKDIATGMTKVVTNVDATGTNVPAMGATQYYLQQEVTYNGDPKWTFAQEFTNS